VERSHAPGLLWAPTFPPSSTNRVTVALSRSTAGYEVVSRSCPADRTPCLWLLGYHISGPLIGITSS